MKITSLFMLLFALTFVSCKDDCETPPAPATNIIGTWTSNLGGDQVEFKTGGELIDPEGALIDIGGTDQTKTYTFISDETIEFKAEGASGSISSEFGFNNISCDEISFTFLGIPVGFTRQE